jgi:hypothetical protein
MGKRRFNELIAIILLGGNRGTFQFNYFVFTRPDRQSDFAAEGWTTIQELQTTTVEKRPEA